VIPSLPNLILSDIAHLILDSAIEDAAKQGRMNAFPLCRARFGGAQTLKQRAAMMIADFFLRRCWYPRYNSENERDFVPHKRIASFASAGHSGPRGIDFGWVTASQVLPYSQPPYERISYKHQWIMKRCCGQNRAKMYMLDYSDLWPMYGRRVCCDETEKEQVNDDIAG
jgi:hypothetical protein